MQLLPDAKSFNIGTQLFMTKWREELGELATYFHDNWIAKNQNWYEGFVPGCPSTNNGLEATHRVFKADLKQEQQPLSQFRETAKQLIYRASLLRQPGKEKEFSRMVDKSELKLNDKSLKWLTSKPDVLEMNGTLLEMDQKSRRPNIHFSRISTLASKSI